MALVLDRQKEVQHRRSTVGYTPPQQQDYLTPCYTLGTFTVRRRLRILVPALRKQANMATALAVGVGVAAAAFLVRSSLPTSESATCLTLVKTGSRRSGSFPQVSTRGGGRFGAGKGVLQRGLRAKDEQAGSCADTAAQVGFSAWYTVGLFWGS